MLFAVQQHVFSSWSTFLRTSAWQLYVIVIWDKGTYHARLSQRVKELLRLLPPTGPESVFSNEEQGNLLVAI